VVAAVVALAAVLVGAWIVCAEWRAELQSRQASRLAQRYGIEHRLTRRTSERPAAPYDRATAVGLCRCGELHDAALMPLELLIAGGVEVQLSRWRCR